MKEYEIWEGQILSGPGMEDGPQGPFFKGKYEANSFKEACMICYKNNQSFNPDTLSIWGIKLYDNEKDAHDLEKYITK